MTNKDRDAADVYLLNFEKPDMHYLKDELVGHTTLAVLSLLGIAMYSLSYTLVYAGSSKTPIVAVLEMWMVSSHLALSICCMLIQGVGVTVLRLKRPLPFIASAQSSLFLGIAILTTFLGIFCVREGKHYCTAFFGAAAVPKFSAVGCFAWAWIMYVSSLGCQTWGGGGFSLGLSDFGCMLISAILVIVPSSIIAKEHDTCDTMNKNVVFEYFCSSNTMMCTSWLVPIMCYMAFIFFSIGFSLKYTKNSTVLSYLGLILRIFGSIILGVCGLLYVFLSPISEFNHYGMCVFLCFVCIVENLISHRWIPHRRLNYGGGHNEHRKNNNTNSFFMEML